MALYSLQLKSRLFCVPQFLARKCKLLDSAYDYCLQRFPISARTLRPSEESRAPRWLFDELFIMQTLNLKLCKEARKHFFDIDLLIWDLPNYGISWAFFLKRFRSTTRVLATRENETGFTNGRIVQRWFARFTFLVVYRASMLTSLSLAALSEGWDSSHVLLHSSKIFPQKRW